MTLSQQKFINFLPIAISILLLGLIAVQLANITLQLFFESDVASEEQVEFKASFNNKPQTKNPVIQYAQQISQKHLLGEAGAVEKVKEEVIDAPETKLDLKLRGILATGDELGLAIISKGRQEEKMYKIGDKLPGNATLNAVYADRVLIESSRGLETLRIELDKNRLSSTDLKSSEGNLPPTLPPRGTSKSNRKLSDLRKEIIRNPLSFAKKISILPEKSENGKLLGYKLNPKTDKALFEELGLRSGDIATSINGLDLSESKNARRAMNILRRSKKINMTVLRNGQEVLIEQQL